MNIKATGMELTPAIGQYIQTKLAAVIKLVPSITQVDVEVARTSKRHRSGPYYRAEVNIAVPGLSRELRAEEQEEDLYAAIDAVHDTLRRELTAYKGKRQAVRRRASTTRRRLKEGA